MLEKSEGGVLARTLQWLSQKDKHGTPTWVYAVLLAAAFILGVVLTSYGVANNDYGPLWGGAFLIAISVVIAITKTWASLKELLWDTMNAMNRLADRIFTDYRGRLMAEREAHASTRGQLLDIRRELKEVQSANRRAFESRAATIEELREARAASEKLSRDLAAANARARNAEDNATRHVSISAELRKGRLDLLRRVIVKMEATNRLRGTQEGGPLYRDALKMALAEMKPDDDGYDHYTEQLDRIKQQIKTAHEKRKRDKRNKRKKRAKKKTTGTKK